MATGNALLGTLRKSIGDVTFYRTDGQQRARARIRKIANPQSTAQSIQRMVLATVAKMAAAYEPIVNHSWEGVAEGTDSVRYFRSLAMRRARRAAIASVQDAEEVPPAIYALKGAPIVGALAGVPVSRGSLDMIDYAGWWDVEADEDGLVVALQGTYTDLDAIVINSEATYRQALAFLGLEPGNELTMVILLSNPNVVAAQYDQGDGDIYTQYAQQVRYCRWTFVSSLPDNFTGKLFTTTTGGKLFFNSALIASKSGREPYAKVDATDDSALYFVVNDVYVGAQVLSAAVIRSALEDGTYKYSDADMIQSGRLASNDASPVYMSYQDVNSKLALGSDYYLQQAVATPL